MADLPYGLGKGSIYSALATNILSISLLEMIDVLCGRWFGSPVLLKYLAELRAGGSGRKAYFH